MKTNPSLSPTAVLLAGLVACSAALSTPAQPAINPLTGLPGAATGIPVMPGPDGRPPTPVLGIAHAPDFEAPQPDPAVKAVAAVHQQITEGQYDDALQGCLAFYHQLQGDHTLDPIVDDWVELGRRYPQARQELVKIRDYLTAEFTRGGGYALQFGEVKAINAAWGEDAATVTLFKMIEQRDRKLAGQCYAYAEPVLMQQGEYALCLKCLGAPQAQFESLRQNWDRQKKLRQHVAEMEKASAERLAEMRKAQQQRMEAWAEKSHQPPPPALPPLPPRPDLGQMATNDFVGNVRKLVELVVATGDKPGAERIRDQALAVVDDDRVQSAVADAEQKLCQ